MKIKKAPFFSGGELRFGLCAAAAMLHAAALALDVEVLGVSQDRMRKVSVIYNLQADAAVVTVDFLTNGVSIGEENFRTLSGDVNRIVTGAGEHTLQWLKPRREWADHLVTDGSFTAVVTAWATNAPPDYLAVDLNGVDAPRYYVSAKALPDPIGSIVWRTTKLLMRRIHAKGQTFLIGSSPDERAATSSSTFADEMFRRVTFSDDYYIGVFEFTQGQYKTLYGSYNTTSRARNLPDPDLYPLTLQTYNSIRGSYESNVCWPQTGRKTVGGYIAKLREKCGGIGFDLPTEWQWEVACKAGVQGILYSGEEYSEEALYRLAWVYGNSTTNGARELHPVGDRLPNSWGLYDMIGNATELMVNVYGSELASGPYVDPVGPPGASDSKHMRRGGRFSLDIKYNRPASRYLQGAAPTATSSEDGFRVICPPGLYWE